MIRVIRSPEPPNTLLTARSYHGDDVRERLRQDFFNKCYLCEGVLDYDFQIDHLRGQTDFPGLTQTWSNLFPAHAQCNKRRKKWGELGMLDDRGKQLNWPRGGLLDCTVDDIDSRLEQWLESSPDKLAVHFAPRDHNDRAARNTAEELTHIHGTHGGELIRQAIHRQYTHILETLSSLQVAAVGSRERVRRTRELALKLSAQAPYSAVIRGTINKYVPAELRSPLGLT